LVLRNQLREPRLEVLVLAPSLDVLVDRLAHSLGNVHSIRLGDGLKLGCLLFRKAHRESLGHSSSWQESIGTV
jgi:hypothetical protein